MKWTMCKICKSKCCHFTSRKGCSVSKNELYRIEKELKKKINVISVGKLFQTINPSKICQFNHNGCILKNKPLSCEIFPFCPTPSGWVVKTKCYYWNKLTDKDLKNVQAQFAKRKSNWAGKFSKLNAKQFR